MIAVSQSLRDQLGYVLRLGLSFIISRSKGSRQCISFPSFFAQNLNFDEVFIGSVLRTAELMYILQSSALFKILIRISFVSSPTGACGPDRVGQMDLVN